MKKAVLFFAFILLSNLSFSQEVYKETHDNGKTKITGQLDQNGDKTGAWQSFYEDGLLSSAGSYKDGNKTGEWKRFYPNYKPKSIGKYDDDAKTGAWIEYNLFGDYQSGNYKNGKRNGDWKYFNKSDELIGTKRFINGKEQE